MKKIIILLFTIANLLPAYAADCKKTGSTCVDTTASKTFGGVTITLSQIGGCWEYQDTYQCIKPNSVDYCAAISSVPGCNQTGVTNNYAFDNKTVLSETRTYRCGDGYMATPTNTVKLDSSYTITIDTIDTTACDSYTNNPSCKLISKVCKEGPETRLIDGLSVYKDCWKWDESFSCVAENYVNYCSALAATTDCKMISSDCNSYAWNGSCNSYTKKYQCGNPNAVTTSAEVQLVNYTYTITKDSKNTAQCDLITNSNNCELASETCTEAGGTKNINGLDVYKSCWAWSRNYTCQTTNKKSDCDTLVSKGCTLIDSQCIGASLKDGSCGTEARQYKCLTKAEQTTTVEECGTTTFCVGDNCFDTTSPEDKDFGGAVSMMEVMREAGTYIDQKDFQVFKGKMSKCKHKLFGLVNCCNKSSGGQSFKNFQILKAGLKVVGEAADYLVGGYMYDSLQGYETIQKGVGAVLGMTGADGAFNPSFNAYGFGINFSMVDGFSITSFEPSTFALQVAASIVMNLMSCDQTEQILALQRGENLCHYIDPYCSSELPVSGICVEITESYCCYNSKLAKIVNEQGRKQLGLGWGSAANPNCAGLTVEQLSNIDFSKIDFSEFLADVMPKVPTSSATAARNKTTIESKINKYLENK